MKRDKLEKAARLFRDFSGHEPRYVDHGPAQPVDDVQLRVGEVEGIMYETVRDGKRDRYYHEFQRKARPILTASHDGTQLYLLDGAYRFTDRGIEDMAQIALVNPSRRRSRRHRTAAQRRATAKLVAFNRSRRRGGSAVVHRRRRRHVVRAHAVKAHSVRAHRVRRHMSNPFRRRRYHRNPVMGFTQILKDTLVPGAVGAAGALGVDLLIGYLPLPAVLQSGLPRTLTVMAGGIGLGMLVSSFGSRRMGEAVAMGAVTVTLYNTLKGYIVQAFPTLPLQPVATVVVPTAAAPAATAGMGWTSPAQALGWINAPGSGEGEYNYEGMGLYEEGMGMGAYVKAF